MAKQAGRCESCCGGLCGAEAVESCCEAFEGFKACPKRATRQFRSPIETAFGANPGAGPAPVSSPEAFGGNRRLYTLAAPAADHLVLTSARFRFTPGLRLYL